MNKSESIKNLAMALKKAQSEMGEVKFDSTNPFFKSRYASLGAVIETSKKALENNGLSVSQPATTNEYGVGVTTVLMHDSGEFIESTISLPITDQKNIAQEAGKIITYLRRYSLASLLNLYSDEDTDGEQPKKAQPKAQQSKMTLEFAEAVKDSEGNPYGQCTDKDLQGKRIGLVKVLNNKETDPEKIEAYKMKLDAVNVILEARTGG